MAILAGIAVILVGIFMFTKGGGEDGGTKSSAEPTNHIIGEGQAGVTFVEYGDFQCPICAIYYSPLKQAVGQLEKEIFFQFRNLPLVSIHQNAFAAARAAEAADKQGKFWQMHAKLYENQTAWSGASNALNSFKTYAREISLDMAKFERDYASDEINDLINADLDEFEKTGQKQQTPTFFINGQYIENSELSDPQTGIPSAEKIVARLNQAIAEQKNQ